MHSSGAGVGGGLLSEVKERGACRDAASREAGYRITESEKPAELGPCSGRILYNRSSVGWSPGPGPTLQTEPREGRGFASSLAMSLWPS